MDLLGLLKRPDAKTLEFNRDFSSSDGALKAVVAFANTAGGALLIGIDDGPREVCGVADPLDEDERLANLISDRISPSQPHHLIREAPAAGVDARVGSSNHRAAAAWSPCGSCATTRGGRAQPWAA